MIVEFFGMPGSGKTTILNKFIEAQHISGCTVVRGTLDHFSSKKRIFLKLINSLFCVLINPSFYFKNFFFFLIDKKENGINDFINITYLCTRYFKYNNTKKLVIFDQGLLQAYWSVLSFSSKKSSYDFAFFKSKIEKVVIIELEESINRQRLFKRTDNLSRLQQNMKLWNNCRRNYFEVLNYLTSDQCLIYLDSQKELKFNLHRLESVLSNDK